MTAIIDPSNGDQLCSAPEMDAKDATNAVTEAEKVFKTFSKTTARSRARLLYKLNDELLRHKEDIAKIIVAENGKPGVCSHL